MAENNSIQKPGAGAGQSQPQVPTSALLMPLGMMAVLLVMMMFYDRIGQVVGPALYAVIGFNGAAPLLTIIVASLFLVIPSTVVRHFTTDWKGMAKMQKVSKAFRKEYSEAVRENNKHKMKELQKAQQDLMNMQAQMSGQMKFTMVTMVIMLFIFAGLYWIISSGMIEMIVDVPWASNVNLAGNPYLIPNWVLFYMALSLPLGQVVQKLMKLVMWRKELRQTATPAAPQ